MIWAQPMEYSCAATIARDLLPQNNQFQDFEVEHEFDNIGHRTMLLNARRLELKGGRSQLILLAIEDITESKQTQEITGR